MFSGGRFPDEEADIAPAVVGHLAAQAGVAADVLAGYAWTGRTGRRHRRTILAQLAVAAFDEAAEDDAALQLVADRLDAAVRGGLEALLVDGGEGPSFARLAADPGRASLESLSAEIGKLEVLRALALPRDLLRGLHADQVKRFRRRATVENAWELRRHPERIRLALLAFYCGPREGEVVDGPVELLIQVTHRITVKAERRVVEELVEEAREVRGKAGILFRVAEAAVGRPEGVVREVIFPVVGEQTFEALVREARVLGTPRSRRVHTAVRASYGSYYRRMMPRLLAALDFRSNNGAHRPLLDALDAIRRAGGRRIASRVWCGRSGATSWSRTRREAASG